MSDDQPTGNASAAELSAALGDVIADTVADMANMPFFVRPMVKKGYVKRTGKSLDDWKQVAAALARRLSGDPATTRAALLRSTPDLLTALGRLAENYRTAPERAGRAMRDRAALATVREKSRTREAVVRSLAEAIEALPS